MSSNPARGDVYSMQHYVIKFISDFRQVDGFLRFIPVSSTNKTDILLKVALNIITLIPIPMLEVPYLAVKMGGNFKYVTYCDFPYSIVVSGTLKNKSYRII